MVLTFEDLLVLAQPAGRQVVLRDELLHAEVKLADQLQLCLGLVHAGY